MPMVPHSGARTQDEAVVDSGVSDRLSFEHRLQVWSLTSRFTTFVIMSKSLSLKTPVS